MQEKTQGSFRDKKFVCVRYDNVCGVFIAKDFQSDAFYGLQFMRFTGFNLCVLRASIYASYVLQFMRFKGFHLFIYRLQFILFVR